MSGVRIALAIAVTVAVATSVRGEVRVITGPGITPAPTFQAAPQRVEPPPPPPKPPAEIVERRLARVVVVSAAILRAGRITIHVPGLAALDIEETCVDTKGIEWACGRRARAALAALARLNPIVCRLPADARSGDFETPCRLGTTDYAERVIAAGWARAAAGAPALLRLEAEARERRLGIWSDVPTAADAATTPMPSADGVPPDRPPAPLGDPGPAEPPGPSPAASAAR